MRRSVILVVSALVVLSMGAATALAREGKIEKSFSGVQEVRIETVSGDCIIEKGGGDKVTVVVNYTFDDEDYAPRLEQRGKRLVLRERFRGRNVHGHSTWRLTVPASTDIEFSTASGDLEVGGLKSTVEVSTASGDVRLRELEGEVKVRTASGEIEAEQLKGRTKFSTASGNVRLDGATGSIKISTASGDLDASDLDGEIVMSAASGEIELADASGEFEVRSASGDIGARRLALTAESSFSAASGDVEVSLAKTPEHDLQISTASGDAMLNYNNNPIRGLITMTAKARRGHLRAPFDFDEEERYEEWGAEYVTKTTRRGADRPVIEIRTATGRAELRDK